MNRYGKSGASVLRNNKFLLITMVISLLVFLAVTFIMTGNNGFMYDENVMLWADNVSTPFIVSIMSIISMFGSSEVILLLTLGITGVLLFKRDWINGIFFFTVSVGGVFINFILKVLFQRTRPGEEKYIEVFNYSLEIPSYSFPSGHTMRSTILLLLLIYLIFRVLRNTAAKFTTFIVGVLAMIGVALSRIFLEAHYLSDTLGAISISIVWVCLCFLLFRKYQKSKQAVY